MTDDIAYDKNPALAPDTIDEPVPGLRRVMANNPRLFTFKGTMSYILGRGNIAIVDPGPDDPSHIGALLDAVRNEIVTHIFVTHTHRDHSPAVPAIKATGAAVYAEGASRGSRRPRRCGKRMANRPSTAFFGWQPSLTSRRLAVPFSKRYPYRIRCPQAELRFVLNESVLSTPKSELAAF
jgi:glyoxylase-like metal-dependent hydrolase (beta-lactamase superfamily II)